MFHPSSRFTNSCNLSRWNSQNKNSNDFTTELSIYFPSVKISMDLDFWFESATPHVGTVTKYFPVTFALWNAVHVFGRRSAIFRQMPFVYERQTSRTSVRERNRTNALFIYSRSAANRTASVGQSQSMIARVQFAICVSMHAHTRAEIFIAARAAARDARKVFRGGGLLLRPLSAPR